MTSWCFWPLAEFPSDGILVPTVGKPKVASYFTPEEAKEDYLRRKAKARLR